jgi:hypothetical protein
LTWLRFFLTWLLLFWLDWGFSIANGWCFDMI